MLRPYWHQKGYTQGATPFGVLLLVVLPLVLVLALVPMLVGRQTMLSLMIENLSPSTSPA